MIVAIPRPYGPRLLVKVQAPQGEQQVGGLIVLQNQTEEPLVGKVIDVGDVPDIGKDFRVLFSKYAGTVVVIGGEEYHVVTRDDVMLVWNPELALVEEVTA